MLPKAHLTSHCKMSGSRWVITPSWLFVSLRPFFLSYSSVYSCHLFLISSPSVRSIIFLSFIVPLCVWNVPLVSLIFLKRSLVSHSFVFLYFFLLISEEGLRLSYFFLLFFGTLQSDEYIFLFLLCLSLLFFSQLFVSPPQTTTFHFCISFSWGWFWSLPPGQCYEPPTIILQALYLSGLIP